MLINILFYFICKYPRVLVDIKKYVSTHIMDTCTNMGTSTGQIFIQLVGFGGATTHTLLAMLTSLALQLSE